jgi:hypothetical protein
VLWGSFVYQSFKHFGVFDVEIAMSRQVFEAGTSRGRNHFVNGTGRIAGERDHSVAHCLQSVGALRALRHELGPPTG